MYNVPDDEPVGALAFELSVPDVVPNKNAVVAALEPINVDEPTPPFPTVPLVKPHRHDHRHRLPVLQSIVPVPVTLPNPALLPD